MLHGIGGQTIAELDRKMSHRELLRWMAYARIEPFGYHMQNWRAGQVCATLANVFAGKGQAMKQPADFMPKPPDPPRSEEEQRQAVSDKAKLIFMSMVKKQ